jgi:hypothetical protein
MTLSQPALNKVFIAAVAISVFTVGALLSRHGEVQTTALAAPPVAHRATKAVPKAVAPVQAPAAPQPVAASAAIPAPAKTKPVSQPRAYPPLPPLPTNQPAGKGKLPPFPGFGPVAASIPAPEVLTLSGIIQGEPKVAVLRLGEQRYFVKEGDSIGRDRVVKIGSNSVTLQHGRRTQTLRVGE